MSNNDDSRSFFETVFGKKINNTRIFPITTKIVIIFTMLILASNLTTNYINLISNREELISLMKELLVKDLKSLYSFSSTQYQIYEINGDLKNSVKILQNKALYEFKKKKSIALGIKTNGSFLFQASKLKKYERFHDADSLERMMKNKAVNINEGSFVISYNNEDYFAIYKYNPKWDTFILRGEELNEFYSKSRKIFFNISIISILITIACAIIGIFLLKYILRFVHIITSAIMDMSRDQKMEIINMKGASNDDITYLGVSFNSLSSTINNLVQIFRKFANKDVAIKAYKEREVRLEGTKKELTCLFSDIKQFTYMTETLGTDIITLLNLHYDKAIHEILKKDGIIGSIIGDALLAVYGSFDESKDNKSYQALISAYKIQEVAHSLREKMTDKKKKIERQMGKLTPTEGAVFKAVLIEVGVGIDAGQVFYGNIGSNDRMTNTVIGDTVNSASRLEGLTRIYKVSVICSESVKDDIEDNLINHGFYFMELDTVQVKGKTIGKRVYWPIPKSLLKPRMKQEISIYSEALDAYYKGQWRKALTGFRKCSLPAAQIFVSRTRNTTCPEDWNGIWTMQTK